MHIYLVYLSTHMAFYLFVYLCFYSWHISRWGFSPARWDSGRETWVGLTMGEYFFVPLSLSHTSLITMRVGRFGGREQPRPPPLSTYPDPGRRDQIVYSNSVLFASRPESILPSIHPLPYHVQEPMLRHWFTYMQMLSYPCKWKQASRLYY